MSERKIEISPSVLGANLMCLGEEIRRVEELGIGWLHLDHMDGHFVPNISFGPDFCQRDAQADQAVSGRSSDAV